MPCLVLLMRKRVVCRPILGVSANGRMTAASLLAIPTPPQLLTPLAPAPLVLASSRTHVHGQCIVGTSSMVMCATARAGSSRGSLGIGKTVALVTPHPPALRVGDGRVIADQRVVPAPGADMGSSSRAAGVTIVGQDLTFVAPAPLVLTAGYGTRIAIDAEAVVATSSEVMLSSSLTVADWAASERQDLTLAAPAPVGLAIPILLKAIVAAARNVVLSTSLARADDAVSSKGEYLTVLAPLPVLLTGSRLGEGVCAAGGMFMDTPRNTQSFSPVEKRCALLTPTPVFLGEPSRGSRG